MGVERRRGRVDVTEGAGEREPRSAPRFAFARLDPPPSFPYPRLPCSLFPLPTPSPMKGGPPVSRPLLFTYMARTDCEGHSARFPLPLV